MIARLGRRLAALSERFVPDPFVLAILLTFITLLMALAFGAHTRDLGTVEALVRLGDGWFADFYGTGLMKFALQMCIVLITGHALALSRPVRAVIHRVANAAPSAPAAAAMVALVACLASLVQWGLGAIAGAFMAREMGRAFAREGRAVHYPLLGAAGYAGFMVWHGGLSGSAPLKVAEEGHFLADKIGVIPVDQTLLSPLNLVVTAVMLVVIPGVFFALMPRDSAEMVGFEGDLSEEGPPPADGTRGAGTVATLEESALLSRGMGSLALVFLASLFAERGVSAWNLDTINLAFLGLGLVLHRSPRTYVEAIVDGVRGCAGIILQFPFYFGILGILKASGLIVQIGDFFVSISNSTTFPLFTFVSAGIVNFFVPSGGGQWAVQGPVMMEAVERLGVDPAKAVMALSYGDAWTNMLQPFWALPLLGIMNLRARDIVGYTAFLMMVTGPLFLVLLVVL